MVDFKTISIRGRIAYGIMCAESYALSKYPDRDWRPLFQALWGISRDDVYWAEWASDVIDRLPEMVLSDDPRDYEDTDSGVLDQCRALYQGMPEAFNRILSSIVDIEEADAEVPSTRGSCPASCELLSRDAAAGAHSVFLTVHLPEGTSAGPLARARRS